MSSQMTLGEEPGPPGPAGPQGVQGVPGIPGTTDYTALTNRPIRAGSVTATLLDTAIVVTFATAFPDTEYEVFIQPRSSVGVTFFPGTLTASGFTLNLSAGVNATFSYLAIRRT